MSITRPRRPAHRREASGHIIQPVVVNQQNRSVDNAAAVSANGGVALAVEDAARWHYWQQLSDCRAANRSLGLRVEWFDAGQRFVDAGRLGPDPLAVLVYRW